METNLSDDEYREFREDFAERMMQMHCSAHKIDQPNHIIKDAFRIGFDEGFIYGLAKSLISKI